MAVLVIADSRGRALQDIINKIDPSNTITVLVHPGAGSELAVLKSISQIKTIDPSLVIMLTGICDLTWKNRTTKQIGLRHMKSNDNVAHVMQAIRASHELLVAQGVPLVSFATITGADLSDCNHLPRRNMSMDQYLSYCSITKRPHPDQTVLNESILNINKWVVRFNAKNSTKTVWIAGLVHSYYKNRYHHCYKRLLDGCHPDHKTKQAWASQLIKSISRILLLPSPHPPTHPTAPALPLPTCPPPSD